MNIMNIKRKAKAYDEALEQAQKELATCGSMDCDAARQIFRLFPQLRESEDERIRKELLAVINDLVLPDEQKARFNAYLEKQKKIIDSITASRITIRPDGGIERHTIGYLEKQKEQKPAWSEEEMKLLDSIIDDYEKATKSFCGYDGKIGLLKAIRDGEYDLSKQEWREEDIESFIKSYSDSLPMCGEFQSYHDALVHAYRQGVVNTLKSFHPQPKKSGIVLTEEQEKEFGHLFTRPSWKPTEEQMNVFKNTLERLRIAGGTGTWYATLESLYEQLKKL